LSGIDYDAKMICISDMWWQIVFNDSRFYTANIRK
jgi:hypothetical protein